MDVLIKKRVISAGNKTVFFPPGTKVLFHYCTRTCGENSVVLDDSKKTNTPMELLIGKQFKLEAWEIAIKSMALNEIASFTVDRSLTVSYPFVAKTHRDLHKPRNERMGHCCGASLHNQGVGYEDLNDLIKNPKHLEFILELIKVETPDMYEKEVWQMNEEEKIEAIPNLKDAGNKLYNDKEYDKAAEKYALAIGILEQLMLKEKPRDVEWLQFNQQKVPILLNYAQCQLIKKEYYSVIEHCTTVLETEPENVKALFRRGKAHVGAWNPEAAEEDFKMVAQLDPSLSKLVQKELTELNKARKEKTDEDKKKFEGRMF